MPDRLDEFTTPITSLLAPCASGGLSRERAERLAEQLRSLRRARQDALLSSRDYVIRGAGDRTEGTTE